MSEQYVCTHCGYVMVPTGAEPGACTNQGCVLEDRAGKSYHCNGHAQWCTACLRWHYEPLESQLAAATARIEAMATNAEALEDAAANVVRAVNEATEVPPGVFVAVEILAAMLHKGDD